MATLFAGCAVNQNTRLESTIDAIAIPLMERERIPGLAIGVVQGELTTFRCFGVASRESGAVVDTNTLFEVGSVSKTFTALLGAQCVVDGRSQLTDPLHAHVPDLVGTPVGRVTMLQLATYTAGGIPLQVPPNITENSLLNYFRTWTPEFSPGSRRQYSNPSIGYFGRVSAAASGRNFSEMMNGTILPSLGLRNTYLVVPSSAMDRYAFGYNKQGHPVRVTPGVLDAETYGIKATVSDLCTYLRAQMTTDKSAPLSRAITLSHQGHYRIGPMTQALGWESYQYPIALDDLLKGNSPELIFEPMPVEPQAESPPMMLYNKTGTTNGFGAYVLFVPSKRIGIVLLANTPYPITERVKAAYAILGSLDAHLAASHSTPGDHRD